MLLAFLAFLGGVLTILSPCVLPVLPFVFARSEQPFIRSTLPLLLGMALTFAAIATLAAVGGDWAVQLNSLAASRRSSSSPASASRCCRGARPTILARPFVAFGNRLTQAAGNTPRRSSSNPRCSASRSASCGRPARGRSSA